MQVPTIICLSLNEAMAICGLVVGVVSARPLWCLPFLAVATVLNLLVYPDVERTAEDLWGAAFPPPSF